MTDIEIIEAIRRRPFEAFRIEVSDGTRYDIRHPDMVIATPRAAYIGVPMKKKDRGADRVEVVAMEHIVKLLPLSAEKSAGKGA